MIVNGIAEAQNAENAMRERLECAGTVLVEAWQSWGAGTSRREGPTHSRVETARRPTGASSSEHTHSGEKSSKQARRLNFSYSLNSP